MERSEDHPLKGWDKNDKLAFYKAIKTYGTRDIEGMQEYLPHKTRDEIEKVVAYFRGKALQHKKDCMKEKEPSVGYGKQRKRAKKSTTVPLNSWANFLTDSIPFNDLQTETAKALRLIADFEDIPEPALTNDVDFRKIYHALANALEGKPISEDKVVAAVLDKCLLETALTCKAYMRNNDWKNAFKNINLNVTKNISINPFIKPSDNSELSVLQDLIELKNYNPLNIPEKYLKLSSLS